MTFKELGLSQPLTSAIEQMGFESPMPVQEQVIPLLLGEGRDIIVLAQTGTGKTAAFGLPILQNLTPQKKHPQALILAPTRELCMQIMRDLSLYAVHMSGVNLLAVYGGASIEEQIRILRRGVHVVVATPGRLLDLMRRGEIDLSKVKDVVLDEADEMLSMGFSEDLDAILAEIPEERHLLLFSATMSNEIHKISKSYMANATELTIGERNEANANIHHQYYMVNNDDRFLALKRVVDFYPDIYGIIFCKTKKNTQEIAEQLAKEGYNADALHGDLSQAQRDHVMQRFRNQNLQLLVATDVAARGLDVNNLTHVIHFGLPSDTESYTHRSGRTARAGRSGISIAICTTREQRYIKEIERATAIQFERAHIPSAEEICERRLHDYITKLEQTVPDEEMVAPYINLIEKRLEWMSKEELTKRLMAIELERLLTYYEHAAEVHEVSEKGTRHERNEQDGRERCGKRDSRKGYKTLKLNFGKKDRLQPSILIEIINEGMAERIDIGKIQVMSNHATFEAPSAIAQQIAETLNEFEYRGKPIRITTVATDTPQKSRQRRPYHPLAKKPKRR